MNFTKKTYYKEKLSKLNLSKTKVKSIEFEECIFTSCNFIECEFFKCRFINCKFKNCSLSAVDPVDSSFLEVSFTNSQVTGLDWTKAIKIRDLSFDNCQINYSNFKLLKLSEIKIINCEAKDVDFTEADLTKGDFKDTDFEESRFLKTNLTQANFIGAKNYIIDARYNTLKKTKFSYPEALSLLNSLDIVLED